MGLLSILPQPVVAMPWWCHKLRGDDIPIDQRPSTKPKQRQKVKFSMRDFRDVSVRCVSDSEFFLFIYVYMVNTKYV